MRAQPLSEGPAGAKKAWEAGDLEQEWPCCPLLDGARHAGGPAVEQGLSPAFVEQGNILGHLLPTPKTKFTQKNQCHALNSSLRTTRK